MRRLFLAIVLLVACAKEVPQAPPPAAPPPPAAGPVDGERVVWRLESDPSTLNYVLHSDDDERQVLSHIYDPLIALDRNLGPVPALATRWEVLDGGRTYVFHLDPRATFSDGQRVKASDVVFTLAKIVGDQSTQFASWFETLDLAATKAENDQTVRVVFKEARVTQLLTFNIGIMPEHVYGKGDFAKNTKVIGSGPYVLARRERGRSVLLTRRPDYWREKPHLQELLFRVISDDAVGWNALKRGDLDVGRVSNDTWWREKDQPAAKKIEFHSVYLLSYNAIAWNLADPLLNDARVRRALAMCFDRQAVIDRLYHGQARPVTGPFLPDSWANDPSVHPIEMNLQGASALFASAGWRDTDNDGVLDREGKPFELTLLIPAGNQTAIEQSQIFQDALRRVGVKLAVSPLDGATFFDHILARNFQSAFLAWFNEPDPDPYSLFHSSQKPPDGLNVVGYENAEADELIERGRREFDRGRRTEIYHQFHQILARDQPYLWTVQVASKWGVNERVQNEKVAPGLGLSLWYPGVWEWWVKKK